MYAEMVSFYTLKWYPIPIVLLYKDPVVGPTPPVEMFYSRKNSSLVRSAHKLKSFCNSSLAMPVKSAPLPLRVTP